MNETKKLGRIDVQARWNKQVGAVLIEVWSEVAPKDAAPALRCWADSESAEKLALMISYKASIAKFNAKMLHSTEESRAKDEIDIGNTCRPFDEKEWADISAQMKVDTIADQQRAKEFFESLFGAPPEGDVEPAS